MNWIAPLLSIPENRRKVVRCDGAVMPDTSKSVCIEGVRYASMSDAARALGCSYSKIYRLIGEQWRYEKRARVSP